MRIIENYIQKSFENHTLRPVNQFFLKSLRIVEISLQRFEQIALWSKRVMIISLCSCIFFPKIIFSAMVSTTILVSAKIIFKGLQCSECSLVNLQKKIYNKVAFPNISVASLGDRKQLLLGDYQNVPLKVAAFILEYRAQSDKYFKMLDENLRHLRSIKNDNIKEIKKLVDLNTRFAKKEIVTKINHLHTNFFNKFINNYAYEKYQQSYQANSYSFPFLSLNEYSRKVQNIIDIIHRLQLIVSLEEAVEMPALIEKDYEWIIKNLDKT